VSPRLSRTQTKHATCTPAHHLPANSEALLHVPLSSQSTIGAQVRDIEFASTCEATLLPFHGRCHIAYVPASGVVLGLSKFARLTTLCARRLQSQQGLANDIISALQVISFPCHRQAWGCCAAARYAMQPHRACQAL